MARPQTVIVGTLLVLIAVGVAYVGLSGDSMQQSKTEQAGNASQSTGNQSSDSSQATPAAPTEQVPTPGTYVDYSDGVIASTTGTKLLFFHASWCPQCRALEKDINDKGVPSGVTIIKVDYDSSRDLRQKYGVTLQTTVVRVDDKGDLVEKFVPYSTPTLAAVSENLL